MHTDTYDWVVHSLGSRHERELCREAARSVTAHVEVRGAGLQVREDHVMVECGQVRCGVPRGALLRANKKRCISGGTVVNN